MGRIFGTDGIRGLANRDLTPDLALGVASAAAHVLVESQQGRPQVIVGRDPRASGEFLSAAVEAGLASAGVDVWNAGVVPTPAVAYLTASRDAAFGIMLSASHNPMPDNGIKIFARGGKKLADDVEDRIAAVFEAGLEPGPTGSDVGRIVSGESALDDYVEHLVGSVPGSLDGIKVVIDAANGAASKASPMAFARLGAEVVSLHDAPDGYNINEDCGSTHIGSLQEAVLTNGADIGIAHDGDADRCLAVDEKGQLVDGDQIMAILAVAMQAQGRLSRDTVVATVMSNLGFLIAMRERGIEVLQTAVGDRYVLEAMLAGGYNLGGEQSGHVLQLDHATTGDGTLTALSLVHTLVNADEPMSELAAVMSRLPQVLINVPDVDKARLHDSAALTEAVRAVEADLGEQGRVLLRPSGTEPLVRVMVEATEDGRAREVAEGLAAVVRAELGRSGT